MAGRTIERILVTGALGQIGSELVAALRGRYGRQGVIASDVRPPGSPREAAAAPFEHLDVTDRQALRTLCERRQVDAIVNLAAILSASGEENPLQAWHVNTGGLINSLDVARELGLVRVLSPSSVAVFGRGCPRIDTPQETVLRPTTIYGVTKVTGELLCDYYVSRFGVDARGLRYPGIISSETLPGGGTTDYAVEIFYEAVENRRYSCFVAEHTRLPMMYMPDCIEATIRLFEADGDKLEHHGDFNVAAMSFTAGELAAEIQKHLPDFEVTYAPDHRQAIADSWPQSIDDSAARSEWGWQPDFDLPRMTAEMLEKLVVRHERGELYY